MKSRRYDTGRVEAVKVPTETKLRGEDTDEAQRTRSHDIVTRWAEAEGVDLEGEAGCAKEKFRNVDWAQR